MVEGAVIVRDLNYSRGSNVQNLVCIEVTTYLYSWDTDSQLELWWREAIWHNDLSTTSETNLQKIEL